MEEAGNGAWGSPDQAGLLAVREHWLEKIQGIKQWSRDGKRAPHKPLLILYALGRLQRTGTSASSFVEAEPIVDRLLADFGPPNKTSSAYPFHHLESDGFWNVDALDGYSGTSRIRLRANAATGSFSPDLEAALVALKDADSQTTIIERGFPMPLGAQEEFIEQMTSLVL